MSKTQSTFPVAIAGFCAFASFYATQPLLPLLASLFHASAGRVSLTVTAATAGVAIAAPLIGSVADRIGRKRVIVISAALMAVATALCATSTTLPGLLVWRFLQGVFTPGVFAITVAYIHEEWPRESAGGATAAYVTGTVIGGFTGRAVAGYIATHVDWRSTFLVLGALNAVGAAAVALWLPKEAHFRSGSTHTPFWSAARDHLRNDQLVATYAVGFCVLFSLVATFTYVTFYLAAPPFHLRAAELGSIFFVYLIGAVVTPAAGRAIDRYGNRAALSVAIAAGAGESRSRSSPSFTPSSPVLPSVAQGCSSRRPPPAAISESLRARTGLWRSGSTSRSTTRAGALVAQFPDYSGVGAGGRRVLR